MADFDPDKFLTETSPKEQAAFDPDAFLAQTSRPFAQEKMGRVGDIGPGGTRLAHLARHLAFGAGDNVVAAMQATSDKLHDKTGKVKWSDAYNRDLDFNNRALEEADKLYPVEQWEGNALGTAANTAVTMGAGAVSKGLQAARGLPAAVGPALSFGRRLLVNGGTGAANSLLNGNARQDVRDSEYLKAGKDTLEDALLSAGAGETFHQGGRALGWVGKKLINGIAEKSDAVKRLLSRGIPLTTGQQIPDSAYNRLEQAAEHAPATGHTVEAQRGVAKKAWEDAAFNEARAPGAGPVVGDDINEKLASVHGPYSKAYDVVGQFPVAPIAEHGGQVVTLPRALHEAANGEGTMASPEDIATVQRFLGDQSGRLSSYLKGDQPLTASQLIAMRSEIRKAGREALSQQQINKAQLLGNAEDKLTHSILNQLPQEGADMLNDIDAHYGRYKTLENAVYRAKDQVAELTPSKLSDAVRNNTASKGSYARGGGGVLRELAKDGAEVFNQTNPKTGAGAIFHGWTGVPAGAAFGGVNNSPTLQRAILGGTAPQQSLQRALPAISAVAEPISDTASRQAAIIAALLRRQSPKDDTQ